MKKGYIISNGYINLQKMKDLVKQFENLFNKYDCDVNILNTSKVFPVIESNGFIKFDGLENNSDFILFWDKDVLLADVLERAGHRLYNRAKPIEICDNKIFTHYYLANNGIIMPKTIPAPLIFEGSPFYDDNFINVVEKQLGYPMIIKEAYGSFGNQVYLCNNKQEVKEICLKLKYKPHLFQKFIQESSGKDIRIFIVGGKMVASMLRENENDFRANISNGGKMTYINPPQEYIDVALKAAKIIGLDYCGVDLLIGKDGPILCEVNSNAHFKNIQICSGIDVAEHYVKYILGIK